MYNIQYTFEPITSLASLGANGLPHRAGRYRVTVTYSLSRLHGRSAGESGKVTAELTIRPARLVFSGVEVYSRVYDATTEAEYNLENMYLVGVFGNDDVRANTANASARFQYPDANPNARVIISGVALMGADMHNYYLAPVDTGAAITPRPLHLNIQVDSKVYDGTTTATLLGNIELAGVLPGDEVRIDQATEANFVQSTVGTDISVDIAQSALVGVHSHNYYIAEIEGFGNIYPRTLTVMTTVQQSRVYDATTDLTVTSVYLVNTILGDDVRIASLNAGELSSPDAGIREAVFNFQLTGDDAFNYVLRQPEGITVEIT
ncbi:MAG: YDG domain-containing protein, partial [Oscillospiraceae bacterium]|nr:YDG domain-containing protein [Oscillospiraceae bacterium]